MNVHYRWWSTQSVIDYGTSQEDENRLSIAKESRVKEIYKNGGTMMKASTYIVFQSGTGANSNLMAVNEEVAIHYAV